MPILGTEEVNFTIQLSEDVYDFCDKVVIDRLVTMGSSYRVCFWMDYFPSKGRSLNKDELINEMIERIDNSKIVKARTSRLTRRVEELEKEVEELRPYKTHNDIEMELRHGKE